MKSFKLSGVKFIKDIDGDFIPEQDIYCLIGKHPDIQKGEIAKISLIGFSSDYYNPYVKYGYVNVELENGDIYPIDKVEIIKISSSKEYLKKIGLII